MTGLEGQLVGTDHCTQGGCEVSTSTQPVRASTGLAASTWVECVSLTLINKIDVWSIRL